MSEYKNIGDAYKESALKAVSEAVERHIESKNLDLQITYSAEWDKDISDNVAFYLSQQSAMDGTKYSVYVSPKERLGFGIKDYPGESHLETDEFMPFAYAQGGRLSKPSSYFIAAVVNLDNPQKSVIVKLNGINYKTILTNRVYQELFKEGEPVNFEHMKATAQEMIKSGAVNGWIDAQGRREYFYETPIDKTEKLVNTLKRTSHVLTKELQEMKSWMDTLIQRLNLLSKINTNTKLEDKKDTQYKI